MDTNIKIRCCRDCPVEEIGGYCSTCKRFLCKECVFDHIEHKIMKIENYCKENKVSVYGIAIQLEERRKKRMIEIRNMLKEGPMEHCVALFITGREDFLREKAYMNCSIDEYCACDDADQLFDIDSVMRQRLVNVGRGVKMTEPVKVEKELISGYRIRASLSHQGVLAIYARPCYSYIIQFTNLNTNRQVEMDVENVSFIGFYDSMILLLTYLKPLRETTVESVFNNQKIETFKVIEGTNNVLPDTDVSLLHEKRVLYYSNDNKLYSFNVDTRVNTEIDIGMPCRYIASLTGIDCKMKAVFWNNNDYCTYTLNNDNTVKKVNKKQYEFLSVMFPSRSNPKNIKDAIFKHGYYLIKNGNEINKSKLTGLNPYCSVIRIYKDIFLVYDIKTSSWVLLRIIVP